MAAPPGGADAAPAPRSYSPFGVSRIAVRDAQGTEWAFLEQRKGMAAALERSLVTLLRARGFDARGAGGEAAVPAGGGVPRLEVEIATDELSGVLTVAEDPIARPSPLGIQPVDPGQVNRQEILDDLHKSLRDFFNPAGDVVLIPARDSALGAYSGTLTLKASGAAHPVRANWKPGTPLPGGLHAGWGCGLTCELRRARWSAGTSVYDISTAMTATNTVRLGRQRIPSRLPVAGPDKLPAIQTATLSFERDNWSGTVQHADVVWSLQTSDTADRLAQTIVAEITDPKEDWARVWNPDSTDDSALKASFLRLFHLTNSTQPFAAVLKPTSHDLPPASEAALEELLRSASLHVAWVRPFAELSGSLQETALVRLAEAGDARSRAAFVRWLQTSSEHSPATMDAVCSALIDMGDASPDLVAAIESGAVSSFSHVTSPVRALSLPASSAGIVLRWILLHGASGQRGAAIGLVAERNMKEFIPLIEELLKGHTRSGRLDDPGRIRHADTR